MLPSSVIPNRSIRSALALSLRTKSLAGVMLAAPIMSLVISGCATSTPNYAITLTQAQSIFNTYNHNNAKANATLDTALQNLEEGGTAATIDDANYQAYRDLGKSGYGKYATLIKGPFAYYLPNYGAAGLKQGGSAYFLVTAGNPHKSYSLMLFRKQAGGNWQLVYEPTMDANASLNLIPTANGYVLGNPNVHKPVVSPSTALQDLVNYLNNYTTPNPPLGLLAPGPQTTTFMASNQKFIAQEKAKGITATMTFSQDPATPLILPTRNGVLEFAAYDYSINFTWPKGEYDVQNTARTNWNPLLPPGKYYNGVTGTAINEVVLAIPTHGKIQVLGNYAGVTSETGS